MKYGDFEYEEILVYNFDKVYRFKTIEEAAKKTRVSEKRILDCIKNGHMWRTWSFDYN